MPPGPRPHGSVCLTGPAAPSAARGWIGAVESAGWAVDHRPLVKTGRVEIDARGIQILPSYVALTSANAIPALVRLWAARPDLRVVPHATVGMATARALEQRGVAAELIATGKNVGAVTLAEALIDATEPGDRILWPRSDRANDLRERLVMAGRVVQDPVAYKTVPVDDYVPPEAADMVFFASPSAVETWLARDDVPRTAAVAIGPTTYGELVEHYPRFTTMHRLDQPTPAALNKFLLERSHR